MTIFSEEIIHKRRLNLAIAWESYLQENDCVILACGEPIQKPGGLDQVYPFLPHPSYFWLTGIRRPESVVMYSKKYGWIDFVKPVTKEESLWEGSNGRVNFRGLQDIEGLRSFLANKNFEHIFILGQVSDKIRCFAKNNDLQLQIYLSHAIDSTRRIKDDSEVNLILEAANIANKGYEKIQSIIQPGVTEKDIQIEFEAEIQRYGAHKIPYDTIVGSGINSAVLHAIPTTKKVLKDDLVLIDAGADIYDYCVDITRVFPASGNFSAQQQEIYNIVKESQRRAINICKPNMDWHEVHRESARVIADGLKQLKILKGNTDSILESGAISVFYPHGVGHLVGLRVRDTGHEENQQPQKYCGVTLRVDLKIQENFILTVEPGCYFIPSLIGDASTSLKYKDFIDWAEVDKWKDFGGIRIEDDILITKSSPRVLTEAIKK